MSNKELDLFFKEVEVPYTTVSCATGCVRNIRALDGGMSFELWADVIEGMESNGDITSSNQYFSKFYLIAKIFVFSDFLKDLGGETQIFEGNWISVVYRGYLMNKYGKFLDVAIRIEDPNPVYEDFAIKMLAPTIDNRPTQSRYWLEKIIRFFVFKRGFF